MYRNVALLSVVLAVFATASANLNCYYTNGDQIITYQAPDPSYLCTSYTFTCTDGDTACTAEEQAAGTKKNVYAFTSQSTCDNMVANPSMYSNVVCCNTDLCNAPPTPNAAAPTADNTPTAATPTGSAAPNAATPIKASFASVVVPSTLLIVAAVAIMY